jgi:hypothetical protein
MEKKQMRGGKFVPVLNNLITTSCRLMGEWSIASTWLILELNRYEWAAPRPSHFTLLEIVRLPFIQKASAGPFSP